MELVDFWTIPWCIYLGHLFDTLFFLHSASSGSNHLSTASGAGGPSPAGGAVVSGDNVSASNPFDDVSAGGGGGMSRAFAPTPYATGGPPQARPPPQQGYQTQPGGAYQYGAPGQAQSEYGGQGYGGGASSK